MVGQESLVLCAGGSALTLLRSALADLALRIQVAERPEQAARMAQEGRPLFVLDFDSLGAACEEVWQAVIHVRPHTRILAIASPRRPRDVGPFFTRYRTTNLLARNGEVHVGDLRSTVSKILQGEVFGMARYLAPNTHVREQSFHASESKEGLVAMVQAAGREARLDDRLIDQLATVTDEMVTNALYNAPVDEQGRPRYADWPRTRPVTLSPDERAVLSIGADTQRVTISVSDPFGSLGPDCVMDYLAKCFGRGSDQMDEKAGGAGLGMYLMFNSLSQFVVNIAAGKRTEMIGIVDIPSSYREFAGRSKSFNLFVADVG
jgi:anti-sigma regulatory factor (Ser/Thr protein kinase)